MADQHTFNDNDFAEHYRTRYGHTGRSYMDYRGAYRYGWEMAHDQRHQGRDWTTLESEARHDWQRRHPQRPWDDIRGAVLEGWNRGHRAGGSLGANNDQLASGLRSGATGYVDRPAGQRGTAQGAGNIRERGGSGRPLQDAMAGDQGDLPGMGGLSGPTSAAGESGAYGAGSAGELMNLRGAHESVEEASETDLDHLTADDLDEGGLNTMGQSFNEPLTSEARAVAAGLDPRVVDPNNNDSWKWEQSEDLDGTISGDNQRRAPQNPPRSERRPEGAGDDLRRMGDEQRDEESAAQEGAREMGNISGFGSQELGGTRGAGDAGGALTDRSLGEDEEDDLRDMDDPGRAGDMGGRMIGGSAERGGTSSP